VDVPETRYAKSGELHIAYRVEGEGPFDLVVVPPLFWSMEYADKRPAPRAAFRQLASFSRVITFDKRGMGSSDRVAGAPSLEERMDDVRAVMDAVGSSCAALVGASDGGAMSLLFAATYPERVFALALFRAKPRFVWAPDFPWAPPREVYERETEEQLAFRMLPDRVRFERFQEMWAQWRYGEFTWEQFRENDPIGRMALPPGAGAALRRMNMDIDVRPVLAAIQAPTLLMHRAADAPDSAETGDEAIARYMADRIPRSQVVEVAGHGWWYQAMLPPLAEFLAEAWREHQRQRTEPQRVLATVLFTDLVGSTERAVERGPEWQDLLRQHNALIRRELLRFRGQEIDTAGDGFFASGFDGPARAIRCACAIRDAIINLGLGVRVGVHTGECDLVDGKLSGLAVTIGSRVAAHAHEGEVLVSGTVKDLVAGSGIEFEPRGSHALKGLGDWPLFAVLAA